MAARSEGLIFRTREKTPHLAGNIERRWLCPRVNGSWHQFPRFRNTHLRSVSCQPDLLHFWMGHKGGERGEAMTELYSKLSRNREFRLKESERCGIGFEIGSPWFEQVEQMGPTPDPHEFRAHRRRNRAKKQTVKV